jgi:hypothetical protein
MMYVPYLTVAQLKEKSKSHYLLLQYYARIIPGKKDRKDVSTALLWTATPEGKTWWNDVAQGRCPVLSFEQKLLIFYMRIYLLFKGAPTENPATHE